MLLRLEMSLISSPDFVKLVVISWVGGFSAMVTGVQTAEQSVRFQQIPEKENAITHFPQRYRQTNIHTHPPCTDGCVEICGDGNLGLDCHNVQIHQIVEVKIKDGAICGSKTH